MLGQTTQRIAATIGNLLCINFGLIFAITPAQVHLYQSFATPLNRIADVNEAAWVSGYLFLGCAFGAFLAALLTWKIGPKSMLLLSGLLQVFSWFTIHFAYALVHIYFSRVFAGIAAGAAFAVLPIYIAEISEEQHCLPLTISIDIWRTVGIFVGFVLGQYLSYDYMCIAGICLSVLFQLLFPFVQESPYHFLRRQNVPSMEKALRWFRGICDVDDRTKPEFLREVDEFKSKMQSKEIASKQPFSYLIKLWIYSLMLTAATQMTGVLFILNFNTEILTHTLDANGLSIDLDILILAAMQFVGVIFALRIIERINRKILLCTALLICGVSLIVYGIFITNGIQWHAAWLELVLPSLVMLTANVGIYPLSTIIMGEMLPSKLRLQISTITSSLSWLLTFLFIQGFNIITAYINISGCLWIFAGFCLASAIFAVFFLPETRGRSLKEIQTNMGYFARGNVASSNVC